MSEFRVSLLQPTPRRWSVRFAVRSLRDDDRIPNSWGINCRSRRRHSVARVAVVLAPALPVPSRLEATHGGNHRGRADDRLEPDE